MKATSAKYMFDEDFATGERPTITVVEAERRRADAESQAYRNGFAAGLAQAQAETAQRAAEALARLADGLAGIDRALKGIEARLETEAVEVAVAVAGKLAPELIAREPFAEISRFGHRLLPPSGEDAARGGPHRQRHSRRGQGTSSRPLRRGAASKAAWWCSATTRWRPATAGSNGPTAASSAMKRQRSLPSMTWSADTSRRGTPTRSIRISGDRCDE